MGNTSLWTQIQNMCSRNQVHIKKDKINIVVLVAGTVDPGNMHKNTFKEDPFRFKRAQSYQDFLQPILLKDNNWYWGENEDMIKCLHNMKEEYNNLHILEAHGWSGDNSVKNREIAGSYLADRLCGANGEKAYYKGYLDNHVSFHFIGHSHGGNVINELTKRISNLDEWPDIWKIKSITYLSTPFFKKLHQVNTIKFHKDCKIINVANKFDLTQRVIADFSLDQLVHARQRYKNSKSEIDEIIGEIKGFDIDLLHTVLAVRPMPVGIKAKMIPPFFETKWEWFLSSEGGKELYREFIYLFNNSISLIKEIRDIIEFLNTDYVIKNDNGDEHKIKTLSDSVKNKITLELDFIEYPLNIALTNFQTRLSKNKFPIAGFFEDLSFDNFIQSIINLFKIDTNTLSSNLTELIYLVFTEITDVFDDTVVTPSTQLRGSDFENSILDIDVTSYDEFKGIHDEAYDKFIYYLEGDEIVYHNLNSKKSLISIIFTLLVQLESVQDHKNTINRWTNTIGDLIEHWETIDGWTSLDNTIYEKRIKEIHKILNDHMLIINERDFGDLIVKSDPKEDPSTNEKIPQRGSLDYLLRVSHSVSRMVFHTSTRLIFERQLDTKLKKNMR